MCSNCTCQWVETELNIFLSSLNWIPQNAVYFFHICLSENEVPIGNALFMTTSFSPWNTSSAHGELVKGRLFVSKFKFNNVIAIE